MVCSVGIVKHTKDAGQSFCTAQYSGNCGLIKCFSCNLESDMLLIFDDFCNFKMGEVDTTGKKLSV